MANDVDAEFLSRATAHIDLSNGQLSHAPDRGVVAGSMLYATSRFCAYSAAAGFKSADELKEARARILAHYQEQFSKMVEDNLDDYINNFDKYGRA